MLEPKADGFRNVRQDGVGKGRSTEELLVDKASLLGLSAPEMTLLVAGLRVLGANADGSTHGVFTDNVGTLSNDFLVNLLDMDIEWTQSADSDEVFEGRKRGSDDVVWTGTRADLVFGSHSQLRAIAEVYASDDAKEAFVCEFVSAWNKVMNADRFDLKG